MKNCVFLYNVKHNIQVKKPRFLIVDPEDSESLFIANQNEIFRYDFNKKQLDKLCELSKNEGEIVSIEYLSLSSDIVLAAKTGIVKQFNLHSKLNQEVTFCEGGIEKMSWSPDQEVVIFVTKSQLLVVMSCSFDPISEQVLDDMSSFGEGEFITAGWGKKETQFHGSVGKQTAKQKTDFIIPNNINELPQYINISWRADGELFTVSFVGSYGRMFKVFNREGRLQYTSQKLNDLGECISWRPSGNWIGVPHKLPNKYTIGLFEKNGLRHREIILPFQKEDEIVKSLTWSQDSEILVIQTIKDEKTNLYFYTICNYHWYLKKAMIFTTKICSLKWDLGIGQEGKLHILMENGQYIYYRCHCFAQYSYGDNETNKGIVAVIDGKNLLLTDFRNGIVPPPMSSYNYKHSANIIACGFLKNSIKVYKDLNKLFIVDYENKISFFTVEFEKTAYSQKLKSIKSYCSQNYQNNLVNNAYQFLWLNENSMIFCYSNGDKSEICLSTLNEKKECNFEKLFIYPINGIIGNIASINETEFLAIFINGRTQRFHIENNVIDTTGLFINESVFCQKIECVIKQNSVKLIGLNNNNLFINGIKILEDVTSFFSFENYLVFTQLNCMKFYRFDLNKVVAERKIERGGKLIIIIASNSKTILQMPRGNLEVINPRILSLEIVGMYLDKCQYLKAFNFLRKQRINLNIIFDHNPRKFMENLQIFLNEVNNPNWLNLFILELQNEDTTKTMYSSNYIGCENAYPENYIIGDKIKYICENLCQKMKELNLRDYMLPIITIYVKVGDLEKSLDLIWNEKKQESKKFGKYSENISYEKTISEQALKYLLYLVDVNELYNVALGMYDFGLVLFVATKSQKDPKEYIPFLNQLKKEDEYYRKFKIDLVLKRYENALFNIAKCKEAAKFNEALDFIKDNKLYQKALEAYEYQEENYKIICESYANYLRGMGKLSNASIMYERADNLEQAILSAKHIIDWKRCLTLTNTLHKGDTEQLRNIAISLAISLEEAGKYDDGFYIIKNYVNDDEKAIKCLLKGKLYNRALFEVKLTRNENLDQLVHFSLLNYYDNLTANIYLDHENFVKYKNRLQVVRELRGQKDNFEIDQSQSSINECDLLSDITSINSSRYTRSSTFTGKTFRSSKNKRKHERKLLSLKEGNPFEEIAIIDTIHNLIIKIINEQNHIHEICQSFIEIRRDDLGRNIQKHFKILLNIIKHSLDIIWIPEMQANTSAIVGTNLDYVQYQNAQHYAALNPFKRFKPELSFLDWEHDILQ